MTRTRRPPATERVHPDGIDLESLSTHHLLRRLHTGDREAVSAVGRALPSLARLVDEAARMLAGGGRLIYVGAGTSGRLGALDAAECPPTFGVSPSRVLALVAGGRPALHHSVEGAEDDRRTAAETVRQVQVGSGDLVIGISASGTTPFVLTALRLAARRHARTALITSNPGARPEVDHRVLLATGPERVAGSTRMKAGTAAKMALGLVSTAAFVRLGAVHRGQMIALRPLSQKLRRRAVRMVSQLCGVSEPRAQVTLVRSNWDVRGSLRQLGVRITKKRSK